MTDDGRPITLLACVPCDPKRWPPGIKYKPRAGFKKMRCFACFGRIWVGPAQRKLKKADPGALTYCINCLVERRLLKDDTDLKCLTDE